MASLLRVQLPLQCWCEGLGCGLGSSGGKASLSKTYLVLPLNSSRPAAGKGVVRRREKLRSLPNPSQGRPGKNFPLTRGHGDPNAVPSSRPPQAKQHWANIMFQAKAFAKNVSRSLQSSLRLDNASAGRLRRRLWTIFVGAAAAVVMCAGTWAVYPTPVASALTEENLVFLEAWRTVDRAYIDKTFNGQNWFKYRENALKNVPMNDREETYAAIRKMLATLNDPFTRFLEPEKFRSLKSGAQGAVTGVGLEVGFDSGNPPMLVVVTPVTGGPADKAGVQPGDAILAIDDTPTEGMGLYDAAQRLQGPIDSEVRVQVRRNGSGKSETVQITRQKITLNPVSSKLCTPGNGGDKVGYIRLSTFNSNSTAAVREAIEKLKEEGAKSYVLDIRNNSGGLFPSGVEVAKMWLDKGVIVFIEDSKGIRDIYEQDDPDLAIAPQEPLAVLVNKGTASASEILAGALKDNKRAVILGEATFGKGKIQSVFALSDGSGLAVTIARYVTPGKIDIDKVGITPDRPLPGPLPANGDDFCKLISESSEEGHIDVKDLFAKSR